MTEQAKFNFTRYTYGEMLVMLRKTFDPTKGRRGALTQEEFRLRMKKGGYYTPSKGDLSEIETGKIFPGNTPSDTQSFLRGSMEILKIPPQQRSTYMKVYLNSWLASKNGFGEDFIADITDGPEYTNFGERYRRLIARTE